MLRLLTFSRRGLFFFKRIRIGIRLVRSSFKIIIFKHQKYFFYCFIIALVQFLRILLIGFIDRRIQLSILFTEYLVGQNFYDILVDYFKLPITIKDINLLIFKNCIFLIELFITFYTTIALVYYTRFQIEEAEISIYQSFYKSYKKINLIIQWTIISSIIMFLSAFFGFMGEFLAFIWQLSTGLSLQIIAFENKNISKVMQNSFIYFKKRFGNFLGIDLLIDFIIVTITAIFYYVYQTQITPSFNFLKETHNINFLFIAIVFYILAIVYISEVITFTLLYKIFYIPMNKK